MYAFFSEWVTWVQGTINPDITSSSNGEYEEEDNERVTQVTLAVKKAVDNDCYLDRVLTVCEEDIHHHWERDLYLCVWRESTGYAVRNAGLRFAGSLLSLLQGDLCCKITLISLHNYAARPMLLYIMIKIQISPRFYLLTIIYWKIRKDHLKSVLKVWKLVCFLKLTLQQMNKMKWLKF